MTGLVYPFAIYGAEHTSLPYKSFEMINACCNNCFSVFPEQY